MKADKIVVINKGRVVQQGTHEELLADREGSYWGLANAQKLTFEGDSMKPIARVDEEKAEGETFVSMEFSDGLEIVQKQAKFPRFWSFGVFLWEQKPRWRWYSVMLLGALGAGGKSFTLL